ncbi:Mrna capping enzyme family protein, partial [Globisporangium splendens]
MSIVPSARILPVRCPLSSLYEIHFSNKQKVFTPSTLMEKLIADSRSGTVVNVGTVIDATGGDAFLYDPKEWDDWEVEYVKLKVSIPEDILEQDRQANDDEMLAAFFNAVEKHKSGDNKDMDIAVYGAIGYSFVGFLIVSYLVEYCGQSLDSALSEFAASSPPGVYSPYYLERLYRKYFSTLASSSTRLSCPPAPKWDPAAGKKSKTDIGPEILTEQDQANKFVRKSMPARPQTTTPIGNGKPAYTAPAPVYKPPLYIPPDRADINNRPTKRRKIRSWMDDVPPLAFGEPVDPSSKEHENATKALEKLTGHEGFPGCEAECQVNTLIDGIIVEDQDQDTKVSRYLAFDIIFIDGTPIWQKKLEKRLQCLQNEVILARKNDQTFDYAKEPFRVRMKDHFRLVKTEYLLQKFVKSVTHDVDGVIYTPTEALYNLGGFESDEPIFKFVSSEAGGGIPGLDGSITERRLLSYIQSIPQNK